MTEIWSRKKRCMASRMMALLLCFVLVCGAIFPVDTAAAEVPVQAETAIAEQTEDISDAVLAAEPNTAQITASEPSGATGTESTTESNTPKTSHTAGTESTAQSNASETSDTAGTENTTGSEIAQPNTPEVSDTAGTESTAQSNAPETSDTAGTENTTGSEIAQPNTPEVSNTAGTESTTESNAPETSDTAGTESTTESSVPETSNTAGTESTTESSVPETSNTAGTESTTESSAPETSNTAGTESTTESSAPETSDTAGTENTTGSDMMEPNTSDTDGSGTNTSEMSESAGTEKEDSASADDTVALASDTETENVTITFVVNNENYTNDPGSGNTHLTVSSPIEGGELTYTKWTSDKYKVTGTGTVCSSTIPAGTSFADNGLSMPDLSVTNIGNSNTCSYISSRSWVTQAGIVCGKNTVFHADTTLYLSLYESAGDYYHLDFVCCKEHNSSISFYMSQSATFRLGESVSEDYIPDYTLVTEKFASNYHDVVTFAGWKLMVTETGEMVEFLAGTPITADYVDADNYGNTVKVYAVWEAAPVTAAFVNGDTTVETRSLPAGDVLGALPDMNEYAPEGQMFLGWQYTDADGNLRYAAAETVILADTVYTAVFGDAAYFSVVFHDVQPDGTETDITVDVSVPEGQTLSEAVALSDAVLEDGTPLSDCRWYTVSEDGTKTRMDMSAAVTADMELYTYTYRIVLTLSPEAAEAAIMTLSLVEVETAGDGTLTMTITARDGETLSASDFVVDGVDYSLYAWTTEDGTALDIQSLIAEGVTENITATSTGALSMTGMTAHEGHTVNFYIFIDGQRVLLETGSVTSYTNGGDRYYLSAATLESVYADYGFTAAQLTEGTRYFPHVDAGGTIIWADTAVLTVDGVYFSPINSHPGSVDVYYLPKQTLGAASAAYTGFLTTDTFYTVKVVDAGNKVYENGSVPDTVYALTGNTASVTVSNGDGVAWQCVGLDGATVEGTDNGDGTTTFTISSISQPYVISPVLAEGETIITYDINLSQTPSDAEYGTPMIEGGSTCSVIETENSHTVLAPSMTSYFYTSGKYLGEATFLGWAVNGDTAEGNLISPDEVLELTAYQGTVSLTAVWSAELGGTADVNGSMVNFFVSLAALPEGTTTLSGSTDVSNFTDSVYTVDCGVAGTDARDQELYTDAVAAGSATQYFVLGGTEISNLNTYHDNIVNSLTAGLDKTGEDGESYRFSASFPSDEQVLQTVRQMVASGTTITINGHTITVDELTTENFTIKWYVFKWDNTDGWHIDGYLVAKTGKMVVQKTFAGDAAAIGEVKENYSISVTGEANTVHTGGTLSLSEADYTENTNTYTWIVDVDQYYQYTVTENNYLYTNNTLTTTTAQYNVRNSRFSSENTGGWQTYSNGGVTVTGRGYHEGDSDRLTVAFLNTYTAPGTLILQKVDAATGNLMPNVSFAIAKEGDSDFGVYQTGTGHYTADPNGQSGAALASITTDSSGQAYLYIGGGTYTFMEEVPTGYDDPGTIKAVLQGESDSSYKIVAIADVTASNGEKFVARDESDSSNLTLIVKNYSRTIDLEAEKIWADGENKPVTIQLYRNGAAMGADYTVKLDGKTDTVENTAWKCRFENLPLYADGGLAQYTIREEALGDFKYSEEYADGYRYYDVTYSGMSWLDANGNPTADMAEVETIALSVTNRRSTGALSIRKVDENGAALSGAEFWLYAVPGDSAEETPSYSVTQDADGHNVLETAAQDAGEPGAATYIKSAVSDADGLVSFGSMEAGRYYLVEHSAPDNYEGSDGLYMLVFTGTESTMVRWTGLAWETLAVNEVVNTAQTVDVTITKLVTGSMGDRSRDFDFKVTCTETMEEASGYTLSADGKTADFTLGHNETMTLKGVKKGSTLTITETNAEGYTMTVRVGADNAELDGSSYSVPADASDTVSITVTNNRDGEPDTGVLLDSLPYILILVIAAVGAVLFLKKRKNRDRA